jgi:dephospho-CoA kinase
MKIAVTGGIGSGKSFICHRLLKRGIQVYDCDMAAKRLMHSDQDLHDRLCQLVGPDVYKEGVLQRSVLTEFLLASEQHKQAVNDVVHPVVAKDFEQSGYDWLESAIFFDSKFNTRLVINKVVCVVAPLELRITRIMERDHISRKKALEWINTQMPQDQVAAMSDYLLVSGRDDIEQQIDDMLKQMQNEGIIYKRI